MFFEAKKKRFFSFRATQKKDKKLSFFSCLLNTLLLISHRLSSKKWWVLTTHPLVIIVIINWAFSDHPHPQKLYPRRLNFTNNSLIKFQKKWWRLGYDFWGKNWGHWIAFEVLVEISLENSVTKVPLKNYTPGYKNQGILRERGNPGKMSNSKKKNCH